jgi:hypothetical protein
MIQAFVDDSTSDIGDRRFVLAAYLNSAKAWALFSDAWDEELRADPAIAYLKMSEANSLKGQFSGLSWSHRDEKIRGLARVIRHFKPRSIHCSVSRNDVEAILAPVSPYGLARPYTVCFHALTIRLAHYQVEIGSTTPVDFIFDSQEGLEQEMTMTYDMARRFQPPEVQRLLAVSPIFRDDKDALPLQAADMLAWHVRRQYETSPKAFPVPNILSHDGYHVAIDIEKEHLQITAKRFSTVPGVDLVKSKPGWQEVKKAMVPILDRVPFQAPRASLSERFKSWLARRHLA